MKKVLSVIAIAALSVSFVACTSAAEEAKKKAEADSLAKALTSAFDQLGAALDSTAKATTDSVAVTTPAATEKK